MVLDVPDLEPPPLTLTPRYKKSRGSGYRPPENFIRTEIATPDKECVTLHVLVRVCGKIIAVPHVWDPATGSCRKIYKGSWAELGIEGKISHVTGKLSSLAKKEHLRRARQYLTRDMFEPEQQTP